MTAHDHGHRAEQPLYRPLGWAMVRAPLLPANALAEAGKAADGGTLTPADPLVRLAVTVASHDLAAALARTRPEDPAARRVRGKLARYLIRMCTRPTPFGVFAGVGLAHWADRTDLALAPGPPRTRTRPDMAWLLGLVRRLEEDPEVRAGLRLTTNAAVVLRGGHALLPESGTGDRPGGGAEAVSIRLTAAVRQVLAQARRPTPPAELAAGLAGLAGATPDKAAALVERLRAQGFLQSDLRPPLTGGDPAGHVVRRLAAVPGGRDVATDLDELSRGLARWDGLPPGARVDGWPELVGHATALHPAAPATPVLQTDLALTLGGQGLHPRVATEAARAAELLLRLSPYPAGLPRLESYRRSFLSRYGLERRVPLLELIDPDLGLGPPSDTLAHRAPVPADQRRARLLLDLALAANRECRQVVDLTDRQVEQLTVPRLDPAACPPSLDLALFLPAASPAAVDAGEFRLVVGPNLGAPAAGRHLGRFVDLLGPTARAGLDEITRLEQAASPDTLLAELVYLPERPRAANVAVRPAVRAHEIVLGTAPGVPPRRVVPLDELVVGLHAGRLSVEWPAGDARVVAVQGHMLNPMGAPAPMRFLLDVAADGCCQFTPFSWGPADGLSFRPRVQYGRIVLALAQWRVDATDLPAGASADAFAHALAAWRERWAVPRQVYLSSGDNRLLLDLSDPDQVHVVREELKGLPDARSALFQEALPGPADAWLPGPGGGHICELVVPLVLDRPTRPDGGTPADRPRAEGAAAASPNGAARAVAVDGVVVAQAAGVDGVAAVRAETRLRPPGSDWLYLKLYGSPWQQDELIAGPLRTFGEFVTAAGLADTWFFIRYTDPECHLRIRFHGERSVLLGPLMDQACRWAGDLVATGLGTRFGFDTYEREVERYGGSDGMRAAEALFGTDSSSVARLLQAGEDRELTLDRTDLAVSSVDDLLDSLGLAPAERLAFCRGAGENSRDGGDEYRERGHRLRETIGRPGCPDTAVLRLLLAERRAALAPAADQLGTLRQEGRLRRSHTELCRSYVHMHLNRLMGLDGGGERRVLELLRRTREGLARSPVG
ncbi:lantibiotic dehydratase [Kitasatospora sp. NBC_00240]|uniref:lantibiotic dehydratase n=1 Tax=Kitasatospora sp. NBC_00240 TaxID=2903567 RepID=UPI002255BC35|nr:lantibiotic dehydratase [Kitasatospora sp. NBC_00240]MCX5214687.1 lantibiotic dehydratase [Kitasatospora sp. NBC_00240]